MRRRSPVSTAAVCGLSAFMTFAAVGSAATTIAIVPEVDPGTATFVLAAQPAQEAKLTFDLRAIPPGVEIESAVLRLVPSSMPSFDQHVRIFPQASAQSIGLLIVSPGKTAAESTGTGLVDALTPRTTSLVLHLRTKAAGTTLAYHSATATTSTSRPRLIVSWKDEAPAAGVARHGRQLRYPGNPGDVTPWKYREPDGALLTRPLAKLGIDSIQAGPAFRGDEILLIAKATSLGKPSLYGIGWNGSRHWAYLLPDLHDSSKSWKYLHVDDRDRLLAFRNDGWISVFEDFTGEGGKPKTRIEKAVPGLLLSKRPALSAGGMVTFLNDDGYFRSLSPYPGLKEIWRSPKSVGKAPPPVPSPRGGDGLVYAVSLGSDKGLLVFDAARGDLLLERGFPHPEAFPDDSKPSAFTDFHPPFVVQHQGADWVFLSGFGESTGFLEGYRDFTGEKVPKDWWKQAKKGTISRCLAPPAPGAEPILYCVQDGRLRGFELDGDVHSWCPAVDEKTYPNCPGALAGGGLEATSNLVADGEGNIYFWNERKGLYGFDRHCGCRFEQPLAGPKKTDGSEVELRAGPDGVLYARDTSQLYAYQPSSEGPVAALAADTRYATRGDLTVTATAAPTDGPVFLTAKTNLSLGRLEIPNGANVTCAAGSRISFGRGFRVRKGGTLRCGIVHP